MTSRYLDPPRPRLFAHRGAAGDFPENTLPAFRAAHDAGIPYLEMDVWATADGTVVVHHDETLQRLCGDGRAVSSITLDELKGLDAGYGFSADGGATFPFRDGGITVPALEEVLHAFPEARCNIEIKQDSPAIEDLVVETVRRCRAEDRVLLAAEQDAIMERIRKGCGEVPTSFSRGEVAAFLAWVREGCPQGYAPAGVALQIPETYGEVRLVSPETLRAAHAAGLEVHVWTVNDPDEMKRLLALGVDGIMSDFPERLQEVAGSGD